MLARLSIVLVTLITILSYSHAAKLGDLDRDGQVNGQDLELLREAIQSADVDTLSSSGQRVFLAGDVNLNGDLDGQDITFLEFYVKGEEADKWSADTRLVGMLLGHIKATGRELQKVITECRQLPDENRSKLSSLLREYVANRGGSRKPKRNQPGYGLTILPRDGVFLACLTLCVAEAARLQEAFKNRSLSPNVLRRRLRKAEDAVAQLRALVSRRENIKAETADQLRIGLTDLVAILDEMSSSLPKTVARATTTAKPSSEPTDEPKKPETKVPQKERSQSSSSTLLLFGIGLGLPVAFAVVYLLHQKGQEKPVPKVVSTKPARRPVRRQVKKATADDGRSKAETKKLDVGKLLAAKNTGLPPIENQLRDLLPERYELVELLGAGGMGVVYKALDRRLQRVVAIKAVLNAEGDENDTRVRRFSREAETLAKLKHPNLPEIYDYLKKPIPFLAMEFIEGKTLEAILSGTRVPIKQAVTWAHQLFDVLNYCHEAGVLHRDIKPLNLILDRKGKLRLVDFGLAKSSDQTQLTSDGSMMGTIRYMPPEMLYGSPITNQSDLYSAALVAYELITHDYPFKSEPMPAQIMQTAIPAHEKDEKIPFELSMLLTALLERDPSGRPNSGKAVCTQIEGLVTSL